MREITVTDLRDSERVEQSDEASVVTRSGDPIALLLPFGSLTNAQRRALAELLTENPFIGAVTALTSCDESVSLPPGIDPEL